MKMFITLTKSYINIIPRIPFEDFFSTTFGYISKNAMSSSYTNAIFLKWFVRNILIKQNILQMVQSLN